MVQEEQRGRAVAGSAAAIQRRKRSREHKSVSTKRGERSPARSSDAVSILAPDALGTARFDMVLSLAMRLGNEAAQIKGEKLHISSSGKRARTQQRVHGAPPVAQEAAEALEHALDLFASIVNLLSVLLQRKLN